METSAENRYTYFYAYVVSLVKHNFENINHVKLKIANYKPPKVLYYNYSVFKITMKCLLK